VPGFQVCDGNKVVITDHPLDSLLKYSYKQNMNLTKILKHLSILFATFWNLTQKSGNFFLFFKFW